MWQQPHPIYLAELIYRDRRSPETLNLRVNSAYGGPKHDPLMLAPYLFDVTSHLGVAPNQLDAQRG